MTAHTFPFHGQTLHARPSGALHWPTQSLLCVSDLHFGKSTRLARRGGALLPPYEVESTLARLDAEIEATDPATVICLGDSFDDDRAADEIADSHRLWLLRLMAGREWIWIAGNHDPAPGNLGGSLRAEHHREGITFRHIANAEQQGEISGHYHPKARLAGQSRACFLTSAARVILPAYGTYTGGLFCDAPAFTPLFPQGALAILTGSRALAFPLKAPA